MAGKHKGQAEKTAVVCQLLCVECAVADAAGAVQTPTHSMLHGQRRAALTHTTQRGGLRMHQLAVLHSPSPQPSSYLVVVVIEADVLPAVAVVVVVQPVGAVHIAVVEVAHPVAAVAVVAIVVEGVCCVCGGGGGRCGGAAGCSEARQTTVPCLVLSGGGTA